MRSEILKIIKKLIFSTLCFMIIPGGAFLFAASSASEVELYMNNVFQKQTGISFEGDVYLPIEQLPENFYALFLKESDKTVRIYKPNVNLVLLDDQGRLFGKVKNATPIKFSTLVQVDNLKTEISDLKIIITDPSEKTETIDSQSIKDQKDYFWFKSSEFTYTFETKGSYVIQVSLKDTNSKKWFPVSRIQVLAF